MDYLFPEAFSEEFEDFVSSVADETNEAAKSIKNYMDYFGFDFDTALELVLEKPVKIRPTIEKLLEFFS